MSGVQIPVLAFNNLCPAVPCQLQEAETFAQVQIHPELLGTLIWQNGADLDPDVLYALVSGQPIPSYTKITAL